MKCPSCGKDEHRILRTKETVKHIRRQRECDSCTFRWYTLETPEAEVERAALIVETFNELRTLVGEG